MGSRLVRFGVAIEDDLLRQLDAFVRARGGTRSEMFRDLARSAVAQAQLETDVEAVATLTIVYDHHVRDLTEKLTEVQHDLGDLVRSTLHVHLSHDYCLEVLVLRGRAGELKAIGERICATRGVKHGDITIVPGVFEHAPRTHASETHSPHRPKKGGKGGAARVPRRSRKAGG